VTTSKELESGQDAAERPDSGSPWRIWLVLIGVGLATLTAFRTVLIAPFGLVDPAEFEYWFFIPNRDSGAMSVLVACWLMWNRRKSIVSIRTQRIGWTHWASAFVVLLLFGWAVWMRVQAQLIPVLCAFIATFAAAWGGRSGLRLVAMPCAALLLAFPPPSPLQAEIIWRLQGLTASGANFLLTLAGYSVQLEGTELRMGGHAFVIIEACSGWRGIQILLLVGLVAAELRALPLRRALGVIFAAIPLGIGLNIVRACLVMSTNEELKAEFFESHTPQGIAVLLLGSVILYGLAVLARQHSSKGDKSPLASTSARIAQTPQQFAHWAAFSLALSMTLAVISVLAPLTMDPLVLTKRYAFNFPTSLPPWTGTKLDLDYFFPYSMPFNLQFHVDYRNMEAPGGGDLVDLFIARETPTASGLDRMPDAKLLLPSNDWTIISRDFKRVWQLAIDAEMAIVSRDAGSSLAYVIAWRIRDRGLFRESLQSLLGLHGCSPADTDCVRTVVRIVVPILHDDDLGRDRAARTANRFIDHFILPLRILERV
jgi:exosortase